MNSGKPIKKLTVTSSTNPPAKKPALEINTQPENQLPPPITAKTATQFTAPIDPETHNYKSTSTANTPTNPKVPNSINQSGEFESSPNLNGKKGAPVKKTSQKEPVKVETQPKPAVPSVVGGLGSPKFNPNKDKVLISYNSEKNLATPKNDKKDSKVVRIEELEKIIEEEKSRASELVAKEGELSHVMELLRSENVKLREENGELHKKIEKYKVSNEETKKMLKQRIHSFNEEGEELKTLRLQIKTLEERVEFLLAENQNLKAQLNKFSDYNLKNLAISQVQQMAVSTVREVPLQASRVSQIYLKGSDENDLLEFNNMENMQENLNLQSYISEHEESYLQEFKNNVEIFDKIKQQYEDILNDIDIRYKTMAKEYEENLAQQAAEIYQLELKNDELVQNRDTTKNQSTLSLHLDEIILKNQQEIANLNVLVYDLRSTNKELLEDIQHHRAQCRFLQTELDIERMKKKFKNENDKFEFNVVKLNLLSIIDKLKMQIDKEKSRYHRLHDRWRSHITK